MATQTNIGCGTRWTCWNCGKPMGELFRQKVHLHPPRSHDYFVPYPVTATCYRCGSMNKINYFPF